MPNYSYKCLDCGEEATKTMTVSEYSQPHEFNCECGGQMLRQFKCTAVLDNCPGFCGRNKA